jgi:hypothetical protein
MLKECCVCAAMLLSQMALHIGSAQAKIDPATVQKILAADGTAENYFGRVVVVDGNIAVIGAAGVLNSSSRTPGAVYVFTRSCSGDTIAVGAPLDADVETYSGSAYMFTRSGGVWTQQQKLSMSCIGSSA